MAGALQYGGEHGRRAVFRVGFYRGVEVGKRCCSLEGKLQKWWSMGKSTGGLCSGGGQVG